MANNNLVTVDKSIFVHILDMLDAQQAFFKATKHAKETKTPEAWQARKKCLEESKQLEAYCRQEIKGILENEKGSQEEKRPFQIFDEMNLGDDQNDTRHLAMSNTLLRTNQVSGGFEVTMGVSYQSGMDIVSDSHMVIMLVIDRSEYERIGVRKEATNG